MKELKIDEEKIVNKLADFLRWEVKKAGYEKVILGLSGGLDSTLAAYLCVKALGAANTIALIMPCKKSSKKSISDAEKIARNLGVTYQKIDITPMIDAYFSAFPEADKIRRGNKMARERMTILYDHSRQEKALVVGTSNKTETLLGYSTIYGDMACAINPLGDLYKAQIRQLAKFMGVPQSIIKKTPSAELWPGQTDEGEMNLSYDEVDKLLYLMIDKRCSWDELRRLGFKSEFISKVEERIRRNKFKRRLPKIAKIS